MQKVKKVGLEKEPRTMNESKLQSLIQAWGWVRKNDLDSIKVSITFISYKSATSSSNLNPTYGHRYMWLHFLPSNRKTKQRERTPGWKESI